MVTNKARFLTVPEVIYLGDLLHLLLIALFLALAAALYIGSEAIRYWWWNKRLKNPNLPKINPVAIYFAAMILAAVVLPLGRYLGWYDR